MLELARMLAEKGLIKEVQGYNAILAEAYRQSETVYRSGVFRTIIEERGLKK